MESSVLIEGGKQTFYVCSSTYMEVVDNSNHIKI